MSDSNTSLDFSNLVNLLQVKRTPKKDAVVQQKRKLWKLAQKIENEILEDEFPLYKKEQDDFRKRVARNRERYSK